MKTMYSPKEFGELIGKSVISFQKWDRKGILTAHRSPPNRRYYITEMLSYKRHLYGKELVFVDERNTSKACSGCGHLQSMPLWKHAYRCTKYGLVMDRDKNSAVNILTRFLAQRGPYTSSGECDVQQEDQNGVEVRETSCLNQVQQRELW